MKTAFFIIVFIYSLSVSGQTAHLESFIDLRRDHPNHTGYFAKNNEITKFLIDQTKSGLLTPLNSENQKLTLDEFDTNIKITNDPFSYYYDDYPIEYYLFPADIYTLSVTDIISQETRELERKWISMYLPEDHPDNIEGRDILIAKFNFQEVKNVASNFPKLVWYNSYNLSDSLPMVEALTFEHSRFSPSKYILNQSDDPFIEKFGDDSLIKELKLDWIFQHRPKLDKNGFFETNKPYYNHYTLTKIPAHHDDNSFTVRHNSLPALLLTYLYEGKIKGYFSPTINDIEPVTIEEIQQRMEIYDETREYGEEVYYYDDYSWSDEPVQQNKEEVSIHYYRPEDLSMNITYKYEVFNPSGSRYNLTPETITLYIPATHHLNMKGIQLPVVEVKFEECKTLLNNEMILWINPYNLNDQPLVTTAIEENLYDYTGFYSTDHFGFWDHSMERKENNVWYDWDTDQIYDKKQVDSCLSSTSYCKGITNFQPLFYEATIKDKQTKSVLSYTVSSVKKSEASFHILVRQIIQKKLKVLNFESLEEVSTDSLKVDQLEPSIYLEKRGQQNKDSKSEALVAVVLKDKNSMYSVPLKEVDNINDKSLQKLLFKWRKGKVKTTLYKSYTPLPYSYLKENITVFFRNKH